MTAKQSQQFREEYAAQVGGVLSHVWRRHGDSIVCDPADIATPLVEVVEREEAEGKSDSADAVPRDELRFQSRHKLAVMVAELRDELHEARRAALDTFLNYLFGAGPDVLTVLERLFIYTRAAKRGHVWGMTGTEMAALFGHSKQNWQHKEEKIIEELVTRWSRSEFISSGGKSFEARLAYARSAKGNAHRRNGRHVGDELPPLPEPTGEITLSKAAKIRARLMREDAERKRIAAECDCDPDDINLRAIDPLDD